MITAEQASIKQMHVVINSGLVEKVLAEIEHLIINDMPKNPVYYNYDFIPFDFQKPVVQKVIEVLEPAGYYIRCKYNRPVYSITNHMEIGY